MEIIDHLDQFRFGFIAAGDIGEANFASCSLAGDIVDKASHRIATAVCALCHLGIEEVHDNDENDDKNEWEEP